MSIAVTEAENDQSIPAANSSWRTWLMTGVRRGPIYRRRVRGAHKGLKRMLVEGMGDGVQDQNGWRGFSGAMVRQAVGEAVSSLPARQRQLVKLAYFSDLSNSEIARGLGITVGSVERGLRQAIARVSEHVERGRTAGRRAIYALAMFLGGRWLSEAHQAGTNVQPWVRAGAVVLVTATAGAVIATHGASPIQRAHFDPASVPVVISVPADEVLQGGLVPVRKSTKAVVSAPNAQLPSAGGIKPAAPGAVLPTIVVPPVVVAPVAAPALTVPAHVKVPPLPDPSLPHGLLGA
jgi:DNA-binding CsgD family transcriptional regulator